MPQELNDYKHGLKINLVRNYQTYSLDVWLCNVK